MTGIVINRLCLIVQRSGCVQLFFVKTNCITQASDSLFRICDTFILPWPRGEGGNRRRLATDILIIICPLDAHATIETWVNASTLSLASVFILVCGK